MILKLLKRLTLFSRLLFNYHYLKLIIALFFCVVVTKSNAQILSNFPCYAVAEDNGAPNFFFEYDPLSQSWTNVGVTGTGFIESIATDPINDIIYAMDAGILGTIDVATGAFSAIGTLGTGDGAIGNILLNDVDGLSYDPANEILWASHRISGNGPNTNDLLFKIDPATASVIPGEFANGDDYVIVEEVFDSTFGGSVYDVDDIAYNPYTGILYAIQNQDGPGVITSINQFDGSVEQIIIDFPDDDVEGLGITYLSELYGTTGDNGTTGSQNTFIFIDIVNSSTQTLNTIDPTGNAVDFESFDCLTAVNDLALQKVISSVQPQPILSGDVVTYQITVFNQGDIPNEDIVVSDYIPMGLSLVDQDWSSLSPQLASYNIPGPLNPGQSITFDIDLKVGPTANGTIANYAEISSSFNEDINIANGEDTPLPDVDSVPNNVNDETGDVIIDDQTNGSGPNANQDEDDHDIATFGIGNCIAAGAEYFPCYAVSEDNSAPNTLYLFDQAQNVWVKIGVTGTNFVEAIAADPINNILYAIDGGVLGRLNTLTGAFTAIGTLGTANGENGSILIDDVDGLTYDPINNILIGSHRIGGSGPGTNDILIKINPLTGTLIPSSFVDSNGNPADYAVVEEAFDSTLGAVVYDVDDIALNPYTKELFAIQNQDGPGLITIINSTNGEIDIVVYDTPDDDLEGLGFNGYGELFATSGNNGATGSQNSFIAIDYLNSSSQILAKIDPSGEDVDFESFDCFAGYNDLALRETLSAGQESPFCAGETVTFEIEVFNQGLLSNENILITNYFSTDFELVAGDLWTDQGNQTATASLPCPLSPGESKTLEISFKISDQVACSQVTELAIDNFSEITVSFNPFFIDGNGFQIPLQDIDSEPDFLNNETDVVDNEINEQAITGDEDDHDIETIMVSPANPSAGSLTANSSVICSANNVTIISASPNGNILQGCFTATNENDIVIPDGYQLVYVLTEGTGLVIIDVSSTPSFTVNQLGDYTIHSLVYNPNTLDTSTIVPESTTGFDVNALLVQGGGNICGALNVAGAPVSVNNPSAGTLTAVAPIVCFNGSDAIIEATSNADAIIPTNYSTIYVLTRGAALVIEAVDGNPQFTVTQPGDFTIHTLVYDPNTLDLSIVTPNVTTGFDVNALLVQGGGNICGALDVEGASFVIQNPDAGSLTAVSSPIACLVENEATLTAEATTDPQFPLGYEVLYVLTSGGGLIIEATSTTPSFTVSQLGDYTIHTLVYDPTTLDLSIITPGVTTGFDVNALLVQGGGDICAALDVAGVPFTIGGNIGVTFEANSPTNATCGQAGVALIEISGGVEPYQISWSDGFSLEDRPNIEAGNYSVNVTDALGCTGSLEVTILGSATLELAITETCELTVVGADAVLDYTVSGGNEPYTIEVVDAIGGIVTPNQSGILPVWNTLSEGQYNLTVSDIDGCTTNQSFVICPYSCQLEGVLQEVVNVNCNGSSNGSITISATTNQGAEPITYVWLSGNGSIIDGETLPSINNISAGTYEVRLEDANGCTDELIFEITEPPAFVFVDCNSQDISTTAGMDGTATVIVDGGVAPYTYLWSNGQTTNPAINLSAGIYDLTITDANGCELQSNCTVQSPSCAGFNVDFNATPASCFNSTDGVIEIAATGTSGTVTYNWTPNVASGPLASGLSAGMYEVLVVDGVGCEVSIIGEILEPAELAGVIGKSDVVCFDDNNGTLDLQVSGGTEPYSYLWSNGMSTEDQIDIGPGNYTVTIEDANNCTIVRTDEILEPTELLFSNNSIVTNNISCNGNADGGVSVIVEGGAPPYQYGWSNGETNPTFSGYVAGIYSLTVVDNNGCSLNQDFEITQPEVLEVVDCNAEDVTTNSGTDGTATVVISGGTTPYSYQWSNGQTTNPAINLSAGSYDVVVTDANGCETQTTCSVQSPSCAGYTILENNNVSVSCFGESDGTISVSVEGASGSIDYSWSPNVASDPVATSIPAGFYEITAIDEVGCEATVTVEVIQPEELTGTIQKTDVDCFGDQTGTLEVNVSGGTMPYQYLWSNGRTVEDLNNISSGIYTLTITDANGCVLVLTDEVLQSTKIELIVDNNDIRNTSCSGTNDGLITVTTEGGNPPFTYQWSNGATTPSLSGAVAGSYSLTVVDNSGCNINEDFEITEPEALVIVSCSSEAVTVTQGTDGVASVEVSGGTEPYTFLWSNGRTTNPATNLEAGAYSVTVTDANGCESETTCAVQQPSCSDYSVTIRSTQNVSCFGENDGSIEISVNGASGNLTYNWSGEVSSGSLATSLPAGNYEITAIDDTGCESSAAVVITEPEEFIGTTLVNDVTCFEQSNGSILVELSGGTVPYTYLWSNGSSVEDLENIGSGQFTLTVTDDNGCVLVLNDEVDEPSELAILFDEATDLVNAGCNGLSNGSISMEVEGGISPYTYLWSNGLTTPILSGAVAGFYSLIVTDSNDCTVENSFEVTEPEALMFMECNSEDVTTTEGMDGTATVVIAGGTTPYTYKWSDGQTTNPAINLAPGSYDVSVIDAKGCGTMGTCTVQGVNCLNFEVSVNINQISCNNSEDGSIEVMVTGASGLVTFDWVPDVSSTAIGSNLSSGSYAIEVTDEVGCTEIITAELNNPTPINGSITKTNVLCNGDSDGNLDLQISGGTPPYTYSWNNGSTQEDLTNISVGDYSVTTIDANGCIFIMSETITEPQLLQEEISGGAVISNTTCTNNSAGAIDISLTGGTAPFTFLWSTGEITEDINNLTPGNYFITVTDNNNCTFGVGYDVLETTSCSSDLALIVELAPNQPAEFKEGDDVIFIITIVNQGEDDLTNITVVDYFPVGLTLNDPFWNSIGDNAATLEIGGILDAGSTTVVDMTFTVNSAAPNGLMLNYVEVASAVNSLGDPYQDVDSTPDTVNGNDAGAVAGSPTDNTFDGNGVDDEDDHDVVSFSVQAQSFDLALQTTLSGAPGTSPGEELTLLVTITNQGTIDAYNIIVNQSISETLILNDTNWTQVGNIITTTYQGPLLAGESITIPVNFILAQNAEAGVIIVISELGGATLADGTPAIDEDSTADNDFSNDAGGAPGTPSDNVIIGNGSGTPGTADANLDEDDHDPVIIVVEDLLIDLELDIMLDPRFVSINDVITWNVNVENKGPEDASGVDVLNEFGGDLVYVSDNSAGTYIAESGVWTIGDLAVGESISIEVLTRVSGLNNMELISQVSFANEDDVDSTPNNNIETEDDQDIDRPQPFRNIDVQDPCNCENGIDVDGDGNIDFAYEGIIITSASDGENWVLTSATGLVNAGGMLLTSTTLENRSGGTYLLESYAYTDGVTGFSANFEEVETGTILSISGNACNPCPVTVLNNPPNIGPDQRTCTEPITPIAICVEGFDPDGDNVAILTAETTYNCSIKVFNDTCFTYIPLPGLINVTDTVTVVACDDGNPILCNEMIVLVDVREDCDFVPPVCESNPLLLDCTEFITPLEICVPDFCKLDDDTETIVDAETIFNCSIDFLPDNCFTYTPLPGIDGVDTIYIYASDAFGALDTLVAYIIVTDDCDTYYVANDDETETTTGQPVVIDVLSNDNNNSDCEIEDLSISIATQPTNGTVTLNADGTFEYTPNDGFIGQDSFEYEVCCLAICDVALVTVTVNDDDGEPMANDDDVDTDKNTPVTIDVLENDDPVFQNCDSDDLTLKIISNPVSGSVIISLINKIVYTPNEGFIGQDSFEYEVCCADVCDVAIVTISVNDDDEEPMANDDDVDTDKDMPVTIDVLENDDPVFQNCDSDDLTLNIISDPFSGSVIVYSINEIVYTPEEGFTGEDSFEYEVCCADICDVAMVTVTVKETDLAKDDQVSTDENVPVTINVLENDDPIFQNCDSDDLTLEIVSPPFSGSVIVYSINEITYTPNEGFTGTDSFDYEVCCADVCDIATVSVIVNGKNNPPIAVDDEYVTTINETVTIEILANDYDPDGDEIEVVFIDEPNNGNVIPLSGGTYVYVPDTGFVGIDSFIYVICDDYIVPLCDTATVYITVVNNNPPMVVNEIGEEVDTIFATTLVDTPFDDCIIAVDPDGDNITIDLLQAGLNGTVMFTNDSCFVYTPNDGFVGTDTLIFIACDDGIPSLCDTVTYIIDVIDEDLIPTANPDEETTPINTPVTIPILANDILEPDEPITLEIVEEPENGTVVVTDDNEIIYTPDPDFVGLDSFIYEICDLTSCDTAIVYVNVVPDLVLELIDDAYQTDPDVPISFNVCDNDIYDGFIEVVWFEQPPMGTVGQIEDQGCDFTYIPNGSGVDCFLYVVENAVGAVDTAEVCILVNDPFDCEQIDEVQNTLTPNRDGINEVFSLDNFVTCCNNPEVIIFNRWGGIVYDNKDVQQGESWRGEHHSNAGGNGQMLPDGTYFYCVLCTDPNDPSKVEKLTGFIHLDQ